MSRVRTLMPNFTVLILKVWAYTAKMAEICNFWYKFAQKGYTPISDFFTKFGCAELYCHPPRPQVADGGAASRYRG